MDILFVLIPLSLVLVAGGCWAFFWAVDSGQFDDLDSPGWDAIEASEAATAVNLSGSSSGPTV